VVRISKDEGQNWGDEILVSDSVHNYQTGSHDRFYRLSNDDLIILIHSVEGDPGRPRHLVTDVYGSTDHGRSWKRWTKESLDVPVNPYEQGEYGYWECAIAELGGGEILMYGRNASGWIYESRSKDSGRTWSIPEQTNIRNPLAPPYLKRIPGTSTLMLLSTTMLSPRGRLMGDRNVLASRISEDGGVTWKNHKEIEYHTHDLWYDYPNVLFDGDFVHLSYRMIELKPDKGWDRVNLGYLKLPIVWFTE
jgi:predicted neuraminidase